ncbi:hypothetical protein M2451_001100 [Dysgonomonas sp. PFB1-18]|uniref:choice-of-anchor Q domain-containing protein n=1 Tax=unclassified Dysgonomonas TaxID=2630389 RepID=UPI002476A692|nr:MULTISPECIES: choice-of-anchor Q domain-containing protein [unclassified Dysgonomonas]MDH6308275.1 hypothetical protein [Dysgonomonas sp. PF1-14]MDH6338286.1 hypothetical protein [Dysgonomonas sp. PF1-16]MDH6379783.1 hypothetical protein [Dysgonomonas sp. PFB1-18]MDH6397127.1 hypothetical protein [Dysgonomonas sp. PF1-23]
MKKYLYIIIFIVALGAFNACSDDDDFSTDKGMLLTLSTDKISFDTVFSQIGSATKQFRIYNRNSKSLRIESIELVNPEKSGFRMNIDGEKGTKLTNVEILKKDSLYGFVEVTVNPLDDGNPLLIEDSIRFTVNGNVQYLKLQAVGQDVFIWKNRAITQDSVLTNTKPILVYDSIVIKKGVRVTINEGVKFFMKDNSAIRVHGTINAFGSIEKPIVFRGERFDNIEGNVPYDNVPGQWDGIYIYSESYGNYMENLHARNAVRGMTFYTSDPLQKKAVMLNTVVQNTSEYGVTAINCNIDTSNCLFVNSKGAAMAIMGGEYSFLHCTIANYFRWSSRVEEALILSNSSETGQGVPLTKCDFINSIVYGSVTKELALYDNGSSGFNYKFINCLLKYTETAGDHFVNTIWNQDPLFADVKSNGTYTYSFELQKESPAINKADRAYSLSLPSDLRGKSRLSDTAPDLGCYEWTE